MAILKMPIRNDIPAYTLNIELEGIAYILEFRFNSRQNRWIFDISDSIKDPIVQGVPILIETDLFLKFKDSRLPPGGFIAIDQSGNRNQPDRLNFGNDVVLLYFDSTNYGI